MKVTAFFVEKILNLKYLSIQSNRKRTPKKAEYANSPIY